MHSWISYKSSLSVLVFVLFLSCNDEKEIQEEPVEDQEEIQEAKNLTIFFINDQHGQIDNFSKIKYLVDEEKTKTNVLLVCAGDIFSGNPIVDQYKEKGYPMIDVMNRVGFDICVLGNHEFDYGTEILKDRINQAEFEWVCANVDMLQSGVPQPNPYKTLQVGDLSITILGLVETNGKPNDIIPSTHPWRVSDLSFNRYYDILDQYSDLKKEEESDVYMALTHLGTGSDLSMAEEFPFFDLVIGGHSHQIVNEKINNTPVVQAGSYLSRLGKIELTIFEKEVTESSVSFINLDDINDEDEELASIISAYNDAPEFEKIVGYSDSYHTRNEIGCFYTTALKEYLDVDISFQNGGGIRADIDEGDITALELYNMDPFNNQSVVFTMTIREIKDFLTETGAGLHVSGITLEKTEQDLIIYDESGKELEDNTSMTIGLNDYIPAVYDSYFPLEDADIKELTTAETIIQYLETVNSTVSYDGCNQYFDYD